MAFSIQVTRQKQKLINGYNLAGINGDAEGVFTYEEKKVVYIYIPTHEHDYHVTTTQPTCVKTSPLIHLKGKHITGIKNLKWAAL